jgi:hypothetical protein
MRERGGGGQRWLRERGEDEGRRRLRERGEEE